MIIFLKLAGLAQVILATLALIAGDTDTMRFCILVALIAAVMVKQREGDSK